MLVQCKHPLVVLSYLKLPFELCSLRLLLCSYTHRLGTTYFYQGFAASWRFFLKGCKGSHHGLKHSLSSTVCLNHTVIHKYLINTELYLTFSKYVDKLLLVRSLINILKLACFCIVFYPYFLQILVV